MTNILNQPAKKALEERQGGTDTAQVLPDYMSYSAYTNDNGVREYTIVYVPQTYYGASIPLGTDGAWTYGGLAAPEASTSLPAATSNAALLPSSTPPPSPLASSSIPAISSSALESMESVSSTHSIVSQASSAVSDYSTISEASVRSTSIAHELSSAVSQLSLASVGSVSLDSIFSQASSALSYYSTASAESATSTESVRSASIAFVSTVSHESLSSSVSARSAASTESRESTASARSASSALAASSSASVIAALSVSSTASVASVRSASSSSVASSTSAVGAPSGVTPSASSASLSLNPSATLQPTSTNPSHPLNTRSIIALAIGLFLAVLLVVLIIICFFRLRARRRRGIVTRRLIPSENRRSVHQSFFAPGNVGPVGRTTVQGQDFDVLTPEQRAARERLDNRSLGSFADLGWLWVTGSNRSSRSSRGTRRASRGRPDENMGEEETPLVGAASPPLSPPPHSPTAGPTASPDSPLPPIPLPFASLPRSSSSLGSRHATNSHGHSRSRSRSRLSLARPDSPGDGEQETAELLVAQRASRGPLAKLGRLSWFRKAGLVPSTDSGSDHKQTPPSSPSAGPSNVRPREGMSGQPDMRQRPRGSINSLLEMGVGTAFPTPPPSTTRPGFLTAGPSGALRPLSTSSAHTVYHDAVSSLPPSRPDSPGLGRIVAPPLPTTPPPPRRRPVPPLLPFLPRPPSATLPMGRPDFLDSPIPSPVRHPYDVSGTVPSSWRHNIGHDPDALDLTDDAPAPIAAWRRNKPAMPSAAERAPVESWMSSHENQNPGPRRGTFGPPMLVSTPGERPQSLEGEIDGPEDNDTTARPLVQASSLSSLRDHFSQFGIMPSRERDRDDVPDPASTVEESITSSAQRGAPTSTPRSSVHFSSVPDDMSSFTPMPTSAFGKPKAQSGWPAAPSSS